MRRQNLSPSNREGLGEARRRSDYVLGMDVKRCCRCGEDKSVTEFWKCRSNKDKFQKRWRRHATIVEFSMDELVQRMSVFSGCVYCGKPATTIDHVKPLIRGGPHCLSNFRPACERCNKSKGAKPHTEWLGRFVKPQQLPLP